MSIVEMNEAANKRAHIQIERKARRAPHTPNIKQPSASLHYERPETARYISKAVRAKSKNRPSLPSPEEREYDLIKLDLQLLNILIDQYVQNQKSILAIWHLN